MDLMITSKQVTPAKIDYDIEKIKAKTKADYDYFKQELISAKDEKELKAVRAELNKYIKNANDSRKAIKKELTAPITQFEKDFKSVESQFDPLQEEVKNKIKEIEEATKENKRQQIEQIEGYDSYVEFYGFDDSWYNKTTTIKLITDQISEGLNQLDKATKSIENTADLLQFKDYQRYIDLLKQYEPHEIITQMHSDKSWVDKQSEVEVSAHDKIHTITRTLTGTAEQLKKLKAFADKLNIKWENE